MQNTELEKLSIFYDGSCPLCLAEIHVLQNNNRRQLLKFIDVYDKDAIDEVINCEQALKVIHAQLESGKVIKGPMVFAEAYKRSDVRVLKWLFSCSLFQQFYAVFYQIFAKFRHQISKLIGPVMLKLAQFKYPNKD